MEHRLYRKRGNRNARIFFLSIFLLLLIHVAGGIGMIYFDTSLFAKTTPINLLAMFVLILWNQEDLSSRFYLAILIAFLIGFLSEVAGVNGGFLFGDYSYGDILGFKLMRVPVLISLNWFAVVYSSYVTASLILQFLGYDISNSTVIKLQSLIVQCLLAASIATFFDWLMEPAAVQLGFWEWENEIIPLFNFVSWFGISFFISVVFACFRLSNSNRFAPILLVVQSIFFLFLRIFLK
jgi:putative membrane protein